MARVLLSYSDHKTAAFMTTALEDDGCQVLYVPCDDEVLALTDTFCPQVILLDFSTPSARQLCAKLKNSHPSSAIIALCDNHHIATEYSLCGFNGYLAHPFRLKSLRSAIDIFALAHAS